MWIIDAFNVLGARPDGWWRDRTRALRDLCDVIADWHVGDERVVVVVDGDPSDDVPEGRWRSIEVRYARRAGPDSADRAIIDLVDDADDPSAMTVVTSDAALRAAVSARGASVVGSGAFRARLDNPDPE